jgi:hypothetical protein
MFLFQYEKSANDSETPAPIGVFAARKELDSRERLDGLQVTGTLRKRRTLTQATLE